MITFLATRERIQPIAKEKTSIKNDLKDLSKNIPWMLLFIVTILFILFVCIRLSVTTHYFKYYVGEQVVPWLAQLGNILCQCVNPLIRLINFSLSWLGVNISTLTPLANNHVFGFEVLASIFNSVGQGLSLIGVLLVPWFAKIMEEKVQ